AIRPDRDPVDAGNGRDPGAGADRDHDVAALERVGDAVVADLDPTAIGDPGLAAVAHRASLLERPEMRPVVGLGGVERPIDHPVPSLRGLPPRPGLRVLVMATGRVEERLRGDAADVGAAAAEPQPVHDRDARAAAASLLAGRLAGG